MDEGVWCLTDLDSLPPKPPPILLTVTTTLLAVSPSTPATVSWVRVGFWVLAMIFISSSPLKISLLYFVKHFQNYLGMAMVAWVSR